MSASTKKRKVLNLEDKVAVLDAVTAGKKKDVAARFGILASSLSTILNVKDAIRRAVEAGTSGKKKKLKQSTYADVDKAVFTRFMDMRARNVPISGAFLQQKAKDYACILGCDDLMASNGWLQSFKNRYGIVGRMIISGESSSADSESAASWVEKKLPGILQQYEPRDTYNADGTALFYEMLPKNRALTLKGDVCHGGKQSKRRLTVLLCMNSGGSEKRVLLVIGKSARPRCFKGAWRMPVTYLANAKAWMTRDSTPFIQIFKMDCLWEEDDPGITTTEESTYEDVFDPTYLEEVQEAIQRISIKHSGALINVDYNLNSPLLDERPQAVLRKLQGFLVEERLSLIPGVKCAAEALKSLPIKWDYVASSEGFHKWVAREIFEGDLKSRQFSKRFSSLLSPSGDPVKILEVFWTNLTDD